MLGVLQNLGPEGRTRTDTSSLTADFESAASTNFTTSGKVLQADQLVVAILLSNLELSII